MKCMNYDPPDPPSNGVNPITDTVSAKRTERALTIKTNAHIYLKCLLYGTN